MTDRANMESLIRQFRKKGAGFDEFVWAAWQEWLAQAGQGIASDKNTLDSKREEVRRTLKGCPD